MANPCVGSKEVVGLTRVELVTLWMSTRCSNQAELQTLKSKYNESKLDVKIRSTTQRLQFLQFDLSIDSRNEFLVLELFNW